jgi:hypothetical protein
LLAGLPVGVDLLAELLTGLDLLAQQIRLFGGHMTRARLAVDDAHHAVVGAVACVLAVGTSTAGLVAAQKPHGKGAAAHRLGLGESASEVTDGGGDIGRVGHRGLLSSIILERVPRHNRQFR